MMELTEENSAKKSSGMFCCAASSDFCKAALSISVPWTLGFKHARGAVARLHLERPVVHDARGIDHAVDGTELRQRQLQRPYHVVLTSLVAANDEHLAAQRLDL